MTPKELKAIKALVKTLREGGVTHFKTGEIELNLEPTEVGGRLTARHFPVKEADAGSNPACPAIISVPRETPQGVSVEPDAPIKHENIELKSLLGLSDVELLNRMMPDHTDYGDDGEANA